MNYDELKVGDQVSYKLMPLALGVVIKKGKTVFRVTFMSGVDKHITGSFRVSHYKNYFTIERPHLEKPLVTPLKPRKPK